MPTYKVTIISPSASCVITIESPDVLTTVSGDMLNVVAGFGDITRVRSVITSVQSLMDNCHITKFEMEVEE